MSITELEATHVVADYYDVRDQLKRHIYGRAAAAFAAGDRARDSIRTRRQLAARQRAARAALLNGIGGLPQPANTPLNARVTGFVQRPDHHIEKIIFASRPGHFVTANLYVPQNLRGRTGAVLFLCGHHEQAKHEPEYQYVCQTLVAAGLVVLAQDPIGQGERLSYYDPDKRAATVRWGVTEHEYAGAQCLPLGDSLARYFLHDAMRGIDYLVSRPEVDASRIGVSGNSGGGTQTALLMLAEPRIAAAAPGTFIMSRESYLHTGQAQDAEQVWPGFTTAGFDHEDIVLAMAPRPVCILAVTYDGFPIEGTRRTAARCRRFWEWFGAGSSLELIEDTAIHRYTEKHAAAAARFFSRHLLGHKSKAPPKAVAPIGPARLWCTRSGQVRGEIPGAAFVREANRARANELAAARRSIDAAASVEWLKRRVFAGRTPVAANPRVVWTGSFGKLAVEAAFWFSQDKLVNCGYAFRLRSLAARPLPVTLGLWEGGTTRLRPHLPWIKRVCAAGRAVVVVDVSGSGAVASYPINPYPPDRLYGTIHKFADELLWLGDDLACLRTFDVIRAIDALSQWPGLDATAPVRLYGHGRPAVYAQLAAAIDPRVEQLEIAAGLFSYDRFVRARRYDDRCIKSFLVHGMLRHCDLADLSRLIHQRTTRSY